MCLPDPATERQLVVRMAELEEVIRKLRAEEAGLTPVAADPYIK